MNTFFCNVCNHKFESAGITEEWIDPIYGPCRKQTEKCPACGAKSEEYRVPKKGAVGNIGPNPMPTCGTGGCCGCS